MIYEDVQLKLFCPAETRTADSAAVLWNKVKGAREYRIFINGVETGRTEHTDFTLRGLESGRTYEIEAAAEGVSGRLAGDILFLTPEEKGEELDITTFGAVGDGQTLNTDVIQNAIDACPEGGTVRVPAGTFVTGALFLKSDMTLFLEPGSRLLGSGRLADFPLMKYRFEGLETMCYASLINTKEAEKERLHNIRIQGSGCVDANGSILRRQELAEGRGKPGRAVCLRNADGVYLEGITVRQSPAWCVHLIYCTHVSLNGVSIFTKFDENGRRYEGIANGDGLDPDSCSHVNVFGCTIGSQDDCIAVKSGRNEEGRLVGIPSEHIRITNCTFTSGFGVAMGSEMWGGIRDCLVQDCVFSDVYSIGSIKAPRGRGGAAEDIVYENMRHRNTSREHQDCRWFRGAIYVDEFYSHDTFDARHPEPVGEGTSVIRNILFKNISVETTAGNAVYLAGLPEMPLENICLENVEAKGRYGMKAANIRGLCMKNVAVTAQEGEPYEYHNVEPPEFAGKDEEE